MATVTYTRSYQVDTVVWDGTNIDEIIALVGAPAVERPWDSAIAQPLLRVHGVDLAIGESAVVLHGTMQPPNGSRKMIPDDPEYTP